MDFTKSQQILISPQAILIYEIIIMAGLLTAIVLLARKRKKALKLQQGRLEQQEKARLENRLINEKRR